MKVQTVSWLAPLNPVTYLTGVGNRSFIDKVKVILGLRVKGRDVIEGCEGYHLREEAAPYMALFRT
jgi:hypothetical protein